MGLFDKVKNLATTATGDASAMEGFAGDMSKTIAQSLSEALGKAKEHIKEDASYISYVATPLFKMLPLPVQLFGRERLKWDPIMIDIRDELQLTVKPQLDAEASKKILEIVKKHHAKAN